MFLLHRPDDAPASLDDAALLAAARAGHLPAGTTAALHDGAPAPVGDGPTTFLRPLLQDAGASVPRLRDALGGVCAAASGLPAGHVALASAAGCVVLTVEQGQVHAIRASPAGPPLSTLAVHYRQLDAARAAGRDTPAALIEAGVALGVVEGLVLASGVLALGNVLADGPWTVTSTAGDVGEDRGSRTVHIVELLRRSLGQRDDEAALRAALALPEGTIVAPDRDVPLPEREASIRAMAASRPSCVLESLLPPAEAGARARVDLLATVGVLVSCHALTASAPKGVAAPQWGVASSGPRPARMPTVPGLSIDLIAAARASASSTAPGIGPSPMLPAMPPVTLPPLLAPPSSATAPPPPALSLEGLAAPPALPALPRSPTSPGIALPRTSSQVNAPMPTPISSPPTTPGLLRPRTNPGLAMSTAGLAPASSPASSPTSLPPRGATNPGIALPRTTSLPPTAPPAATSAPPAGWTPPSFDEFVARRAAELRLDPQDAANRDALENEYLEKAVQAGVRAEAWEPVLPLAERWFFKAANDPTALVTVMRARFRASTMAGRRADVVFEFDAAAARYAEVADVQWALWTLATEQGNTAVVDKVVKRLKRLAPSDPRLAGAVARPRARGVAPAGGTAAAAVVALVVLLSTFGLLVGVGVGDRDGAWSSAWWLRHALFAAGFGVFVAVRGPEGRALARALVAPPPAGLVLLALAGGAASYAATILLLGTVTRTDAPWVGEAAAGVVAAVVQRSFVHALQPSFAREPGDVVTGVAVLVWFEALYAFTYPGIFHGNTNTMLTMPMLIVLGSALPSALLFARSQSVWPPIAWELGILGVLLGAPRL